MKNGRGQTALVAASMLVLALGGFSLWQQMRVRELRAANATLNEERAHAIAMRQKLEREKAQDPAEVARRREEQSELLRLRSEVTRLRGQAAAATKASPRQTPAAAEESQAAAPFIAYTANLAATVPTGQTLVSGGWSLAEGKRTLVLIKPEAQTGSGPDAPAQIDIRNWIIEVPESMLAELGWGQLPASGTNSTLQATLSEVELTKLLARLKETTGAKVLGSPRMMVLEGREAQASIGSMRPGRNGEQFHVGPRIDLVPQVAADGSGITINGAAQITQAVDE